MVTTESTTEVLPSGLEVKPVPNLKRRQRSIYYRRITVKGGDMVWVKTGLLPSDSLGKEYYLSKGFRLTPPEGVDFNEPAQNVSAEVSALATLREENTRLRKQIEEVMERREIGSGRKGRKAKK